ncbi:hypothetical protein [Streptomyces hydrogenans]|uniref:hypothetical protein n=1 Tax=Streptomyces hydrogenans TaxID=1873719 RepID=UPI00278BDE9E|nr:hypothetical protein [Streptomyces hydrogenans]
MAFRPCSGRRSPARHLPTRRLGVVMGVFAMFRRKKKGAAEDAAVATEAAAVTEATEATETDVTTDIAEDGGVTRVVVAGLTAPVESETAEPAPTESALRESAPEESVSDRSASDGSAADESASRASSGEGASEAESEEAVAEVVEIPRQQSVDTAADTDSETGETARR